jgi:hypothetical protein
MLLLALDEYRTSILGVGINAAENLHQGGLAGAVFTYQRMNFAFIKVKGNAIERTNTRKGLRDIAHL